MNKPSYATLKQDLKCANEEAKMYMEEALRLRETLKGVESQRARWEEVSRGADRLCNVLIRALEDAQK